MINGGAGVSLTRSVLSGGDDGCDYDVEAGVDDSSHLSWTWIQEKFKGFCFPTTNLFCHHYTRIGGSHTTQLRTPMTMPYNINQIFYTLLLFYYIACSVPSPSSVSAAAAATVAAAAQAAAAA